MRETDKTGRADIYVGGESEEIVVQPRAFGDFFSMRRLLIALAILVALILVVVFL